MNYILMDFGLLGTLYQESLVRTGAVTRYLSMEGTEVFRHPPTGVSGYFISVTVPVWALPDPPEQDLVVEVPSRISMRQAHLVLFKYGLLNTIQNTINSMPEPNRSIANIEWSKSSEVHRHYGLVTMLGPVLGLSNKQIDDMFIEASTL